MIPTSKRPAAENAIFILCVTFIDSFDQKDAGELRIFFRHFAFVHGGYRLNYGSLEFSFLIFLH